MIKEQLRMLRRRLLRQCGTSFQEVDELIQEAFLRLARYEQQQSAPIRDPVGFLIDVAQRVHIDHLRHAAVVDRVLSREAMEVWSTCWTSGDTPEQEIEAHQLLERLVQRFAAANPQTQQVFLLHRFDGLTYAQIAQVLGVSTATVKRRLAEALLIYDAELAK